MLLFIFRRTYPRISLLDGGRMAIPELAQDFLKFALPAIVSFLASLAYTNHMLAPGHNVTLVPIATWVPGDLTSTEACNVNKEKLLAAAQQVKDKAFTPSSYEYYLITLLDSPSPISKDLVPREFLSRLVDNNIMNCNAKLSPYLGARLSIAAVLGQPVRYLLRRSCLVIYDDVKIPLEISAGQQQPEPATVAVDQSSELIVDLDARHANDEQKQKFSELMQELSKQSVKVDINCFVVSTYTGVPVGGSYSVPQRDLTP